MQAPRMSKFCMCSRVCIICPTYFIEIIDNFLGIIEILSVIGDNLVTKFELIVVI